MFEPTIAVVDAAERAVDAAFVRPLAAFVRDLGSYAAERSDAAARAALRSPFSGVPHVDASALCAATGERRICDAIARGTLAIAHDSAIAARAFARALDAAHGAYREQGATARGHVATIALAFDLDARLDADERATFARILALAERCDATREPGEAWDAATFARALEREAVRANARTSTSPARRPLAARLPERPRVVHRRKAHFSASSLGTYAACERRWYYRYVCSAVEDRGSSASFYGTAFHWALERFHEEFPRADAAAPDVLERKLDGYLNVSYERFRSGFATTVEYELQRRRALRTGRRYLAWFRERARAHPFTVIGTEATVELDLDGYRFIGYIDRLDRDDATAAVTVVDYKTGSIAESAESYRADVARFVDFQLPFYYWARTAAGDRVTRLSLIPLKDAARDVAPIELEVVPIAAPRSYSEATTGTIGIDELERARARMTELAAALADGPLERFPVTDDADACVYCAYRNACRDRPLAREDRFGR